MFYNVMKAKDIIDVENDKFIRKPLMENNESSFNIVTIKKGAIIDTHTSKADGRSGVADDYIFCHGAQSLSSKMMALFGQPCTQAGLPPAFSMHSSHFCMTPDSEGISAP